MLPFQLTTTFETKDQVNCSKSHEKNCHPIAGCTDNLVVEEDCLFCRKYRFLPLLALFSHSSYQGQRAYPWDAEGCVDYRRQLVDFGRGLVNVIQTFGAEIEPSGEGVDAILVFASSDFSGTF